MARLLESFSFVFDHPKLYGGLLLLLLTPPLFRILLYFTPLLLSTALCVFALLTIHPYLTATDAEVQRESRLSYNSRRPPPSPAPSTSSSSLPSSSAPPPPLAPASLEASAHSWLSWMKGLNDIGRAWLEDRLKEQGMALSEPANKETLLSLLQGSFSELVAPPQPCVSEDLVDAQQRATEPEVAVAAAASGYKEAVAMEREITEARDDTEAENEQESMMHLGGHGEREASEKLLESFRGGCDEVPEATQKVLEASRRIIDAVGVLGAATKPQDPQEKQHHHHHHRHGSDDVMSSAASKLVPSRSLKDANSAVPHGAQLGVSTAVSSPSMAPAKLPRKLLEESGTGAISLSKTVEPSCIAFGPVIPDPRAPAPALDGGPIFDEAAAGCDDGEELDVEEAQALVRSEFKMLEMEIEEVAAKLPKIDDILHNFQKTPSRNLLSSSSSKHSAAVEPPMSTSSSSSRSLLFK